jgi:hypothetical protein
VALAAAWAAGPAAGAAPAAGTTEAAEADGFELTLEVRDGHGDKPMIAVWLEDEKGAFVKTLAVCGLTRKYFNALSTWRLASRNKEPGAAVDAVVGATVSWNRRRTLYVPPRVGTRRLLDGGLVIRIESVAHKGQHYRDFRMPIPKDFKGGTVEDPGYVARATFRIPGAPEPDPTGPKPAPP